MKWFKHDSDARNDPRLQAYMESFPRCQAEAYGVYFMLLEIVSERIDESDSAEVEYPIQTWLRQTGLSRQKFTKYVQKLDELCALSANFTQTSCKLSIPKLLKKRDNHTKNLQAKNKSKIENKIEDSLRSSSPPAAPPAPKPKSPNLSRLSIADLPPDWADWTHAAMGWDVETTTDVWLAFRDHWQVKTGKTAMKSDWLATWRNWCKSERPKGKNHGKPSIHSGFNKQNYREGLEGFDVTN